MTAPSNEIARNVMRVEPWHGQRRDKAACLHFGAVQVTCRVTGDPLAKWCPNCDGTQYDRALSPGVARDGGPS